MVLEAPWIITSRAVQWPVSGYQVERQAMNELVLSYSLSSAEHYVKTQTTPSFHHDAVAPTVIIIQSVAP
jgi:hypothetical protein